MPRPELLLACPGVPIVRPVRYFLVPLATFAAVSLAVGDALVGAGCSSTGGGGGGVAGVIGAGGSLVHMLVVSYADLLASSVS
jgi:hypothetical protein